LTLLGIVTLISLIASRDFNWDKSKVWNKNWGLRAMRPDVSMVKVSAGTNYFRRKHTPIY
jgi:hypothetical protein